MVLFAPRKQVMINEMNNPLVTVCETQDEFWDAAREDVLLSIRETLTNYKTCRIGLAGGSTPKTLYEMLAREEDLHWDKIHLIVIDERNVPSDHPQSNLRMIRKSLAREVSLPPGNFIYFDTSLPPESAAKEMARKVSRLKQEREPIFDILILGAGADGHIASLFDGDDAILSQELASTAIAKKYEIPERLTLTVPALRSTARTLLLLKGEGKMPVVKALRGEEEMPRLTALREVIAQSQTKVLYSQ